MSAVTASITAPELSSEQADDETVIHRHTESCLDFTVAGKPSTGLTVYETLKAANQLHTEPLVNSGSKPVTRRFPPSWLTTGPTVLPASSSTVFGVRTALQNSPGTFFPLVEAVRGSSEAFVIGFLDNKEVSMPVPSWLKPIDENFEDIVKLAADMANSRLQSQGSTDTAGSGGGTGDDGGNGEDNQPPPSGEDDMARRLRRRKPRKTTEEIESLHGEEGPKGPPSSPAGSAKDAKDAMFTNSWVNISKSPVSGWGTFANIDLPAGTTILIEKPLLKAKPTQWLQAVRALEIRSSMRYFGLTKWQLGEESEVMSIKRANA